MFRHPMSSSVVKKMENTNEMEKYTMRNKLIRKVKVQSGPEIVIGKRRLPK